MERKIEMKKIQKIWNNYQKWIILIGSIVFLAIFSIYYYYHAVKENVNGNVNIISTLTDNTPQTEIPASGKVIQTFKTSENFNGFQIRLSTLGGTSEDLVSIRIYEQTSGKNLKQWSMPYSELPENKLYDFPIDKTVIVNGEEIYGIEIFNANVSGNGNVYIYNSKEDCYPDGNTYIDDQIQEKDIIFNLYQEKTGAYSFLTPFYIFLAICSILVVALFVLATFYWKLNMEKVFLITVLIMGILYMIILPPFSSPDEPIHFGTAYKISNLIMGKTVSGDNGVVLMRESDANVEYGTIPNVTTYQYTLDHMIEGNDDSATLEWKHNDLGLKNKILHLPSAIGISVARVLHLGSVPLIYLGRFANLLFYIAIVYFAIKITPLGKTFFVAFSLSPMMLELISSYSYDCVIDGMACLSIAYLLHCIYKIDKIQMKDMIILLVLAALFAPCKVVYSLIFVLVIFIPKEKFENKWKYYSFVGLTAAVMFISIAYVNLDSVLALGGINTTGTEVVVTETEVEATPSQYSVAWCIKHPILLCQVYLNTILTYGNYYFTTMFGGLLGWLEIHLSNLVVYLVAFFTFLTLFSENAITQKIKVKHRMVSSGILLAVFMLILLSMFFGCSPYGVYVVLGVQGRYFLTIFPLLLIIVGNKKVKIKQTWDKYILYCLLMVNIYAVLQIFSIVSAR